MPEFYKLKSLLSEYVRKAGDLKFRIAQSNSRLYTLIPSLRRHVSTAQKNAHALLEFFRHQIAEHRARHIDETEAPNDIVDAFIREQRKGDDPTFTYVALLASKLERLLKATRIPPHAYNFNSAIISLST